MDFVRARGDQHRGGGYNGRPAQPYAQVMEQIAHTRASGTALPSGTEQHDAVKFMPY